MSAPGKKLFVADSFDFKLPGRYGRTRRGGLGLNFQHRRGEIRRCRGQGDFTRLSGGLHNHLRQTAEEASFPVAGFGHRLDHRRAAASRSRLPASASASARQRRRDDGDDVLAGTKRGGIEIELVAGGVAGHVLGDGLAVEINPLPLAQIAQQQGNGRVFGIRQFKRAAINVGRRRWRGVCLLAVRRERRNRFARRNRRNQTQPPAGSPRR